MNRTRSQAILGFVMRLLPLALICIPAVLGMGCSAEDILGINNKGSLRGVVYDGAAGGQTRLGGVRVTLVSREVETNNQGEYEFTGIPVGTQELTAYKPGYKTYAANVQIREDNAEDPYANRHSFFMTPGGP